MLWRSIACSLLLLWLAACAASPAIPPTVQHDILTWQAMNSGLAPHVPVTSIAVDPRNPQQIVAGVYGREGLYFSRDGGASWQRLRDDFASQPIFALHLDPHNSARLWLGTADGLYYTTIYYTTIGAFPSDGMNQAWQRVAEWPLAAATFALHAAPTGTLYAGGAHPAVWRMDDGQTWQPLAPVDEDIGAVLAVAVAADDTLLAGTDGAGLYGSRDQGVSWQQVDEIGETFVAALWVAPWDDRLILARTREGLFRSTDGAATWALIGSDFEDRVDAISGVASEEAIYLGMSSGQIYRSRDLGETWQVWGKGVGRDGMFNTLMPLPPESVTVGNSDNLPFLAGTQHGLYQSLDHAQTWQPVSGTVGTFRITALTQTPDGRLYLGNEDGISVSLDQGATWQPQSNGLPQRAVLAIAISPHDPDLFYAATEGDGLYVSIDGGNQWTQLAWDNQIVADILIDPFQPDRLYLQMAYERIYQSDDRGQSWAARWNGMETTTEILSVALSPHQPDLLYAGSHVDMFKSEDGARYWRRIGAEMEGQSIFYLAVDDQDPATVYAGATKGLYHSQDGGDSWQLWGRGLEDVTVTALAFHPTQPAWIYAGTKYNGVYASTDGGQSWQPAIAGMGEISIYKLLVDGEGGWLYAASDRGVWRAALPRVTPF